MVAVERIVFVKGKVDRRRETPCIIVNEMFPVSEAMPRLTTAIAVKLGREHKPAMLAELGPVLKNHRGGLRVYLQVETSQAQKVIIQLEKEHSVRPTHDLISDIESLLGRGSVQLRGEGSRRRKAIEQQKLFAEGPAVDESIPAGMEAELLAEEVE
jgi:hypothetical protein